MQRLAFKDSPSVAFWLEKTAQSEETARAYRRHLEMFTKAVGLNTEEIVSEWHNAKTDFAKRELFLENHAELIERFVVTNLRAMTPNSRKSISLAIVSFYHHNHIPVEIDLPENKKAQVVNHNRTITKEEIARILEHATLRDKCFFLLCLESGLRPNTVVQLRYKHIKQDFEAGGVVVDGVRTMMIRVDSEMLKDNISARWSFIGEEGFSCLKEYLSARGKMSDEDLIFVAVRPKKQEQKENKRARASTKKAGDVLSTSMFSMQFMRIVDNLGLDKKEAGHKRRHLNLYTLRKYFRNNIKTSEPAFKEFWMGHSLGVDKHYFEAHIDDPKTIERHREEYAAGYAFLRVDVESPNVKSMKEIEELRRENDVLKAQMANMVSKEDIQALIDKAIDDAFESRGHWAQAGRRHLKDKK